MVGPEPIEHMDSLFRSVGLPSYIQHSLARGTSRWNVVGVKRVRRVLEVLLPYLYIKRRQAVLVLEYCDSRLGRPYGEAVNERDLEIREQVCALNTKGKNPQRLYAELA